MLFGQNGRGQATWATPTYWAIHLLTHQWLLPGDGPHRLYAASLDDLSGEARRYVAAWPALRPDGRWSIMLINRSANEQFSIRLALKATGEARLYAGAWDGAQYDASDYRWHPEGSSGHPVIDKPPRRIQGVGGEIFLPPYSITVVRTAPEQSSTLARSTLPSNGSPARA